MTDRPSIQQEFSRQALAHLDALYGYALALTRNQAEAEDLVQETYLRATRAFGQLLPDSNLKGWLFTILRNLWLNQLRHARSGPRFVELDADTDEAHATLQQLAAPQGDPLLALLLKVEREQLHQAIGQLSAAHREIIILRDLEGFSYQEIAHILHCPAGTVMSRLGRARAQLKTLLQQLAAGFVPQPAPRKP